MITKVHTAIAFLMICSVTGYCQEIEEDGEDYMSSGWHSEIKEATSRKEAVQAWRNDGFGVLSFWSSSTVFQGRWNDRELSRDLWGEWLMKRAGVPIEDYEAALKKYNPSQFDADEWADLYKEAGFRYMVFIAKQHDGFAWWHSKAKKYNIVDHTEKYNVDVFGELCKAVGKRGIKPGFYYSHGMDWHSPGGRWGPPGRTREEYFEAVVLPHLRELAGEYGPQYVGFFRKNSGLFPVVVGQVSRSRTRFGCGNC
jgi:alpha-L-fucosidase